MAGLSLDYRKTPAEQRVTVWLGPKGSIANYNAPTATEINAMLMASPSISWNDFDFGLQESETMNDPSLADVSTYEDFGAASYGGSMSFYYPKEYSDDSNTHSMVYDLTDLPWTELDVVIRIDGDVKTSVPAADGDFVSTYAVMTDSETNSLQGADALRRTVGMLQQDAFAHRVPVGSPVVTVTGTSTLTAGQSAPFKGTVGGRNYTGALNWRSTEPAVATVSQAGVVTGVASGIATIMAVNEGTGEDGTLEVTVS